ncbi:sugar nucleotide-binding protein [Geothrix fermentans]|uniref:sugar nucleotide-binding protein n=1 Tax=Geothrix fermentans TaxID=44676 RepID=UPI000412742A|nr:sugar nucleotide-binding protein [Geothrix fermentans]
MKVAVLGASGMLGSTVLDVLAASNDFQMVATLRDGHSHALPAGTELRYLDASFPTGIELEQALKGCAWVINCIGVIKHHIDDRHSETVERAIQVNALFPHVLAKAAVATGCKVLQIATDCVYSGRKGAYLESDPHDALDAYGKSKSLGEVSSDGMHHLRCSIIGPEIGSDRRSLLEWFLGHPSGSTVTGYTNHLWNGVTTLHFARLCHGILHENLPLPSLAHVIPADILPKGELLEAIRDSFERKDLGIDLLPAPQAVDRSLSTSDAALNRCLWSAAGYTVPPSLTQMVAELAAWARFRRKA